MENVIVISSCQKQEASPEWGKNILAALEICFILHQPLICKTFETNIKFFDMTFWKQIRIKVN